VFLKSAAHTHRFDQSGNLNQLSTTQVITQGAETTTITFLKMDQRMESGREISANFPLIRDQPAEQVNLSHKASFLQGNFPTPAERTIKAPYPSGNS